MDIYNSILISSAFVFGFIYGLMGALVIYVTGHIIRAFFLVWIDDITSWYNCKFKVKVKVNEDKKI